MRTLMATILATATVGLAGVDDAEARGRRGYVAAGAVVGYAAPARAARYRAPAVAYSYAAPAAYYAPRAGYYAPATVYYAPPAAVLGYRPARAAARRVRAGVVDPPVRRFYGAPAVYGYRAAPAYGYYGYRPGLGYRYSYTIERPAPDYVYGALATRSTAPLPASRQFFQQLDYRSP